MNPLDALRALSQTNDFNPVKLASLRGARESELANRARDPRQDAILAALRGEMAADPYTGAAAQKEQLGREAEYNDALSQGFTGGPVQANGIPLSPVQQLNKYKQGMELHKIEGPERVARIGADANLGVADINAKGNLGRQGLENEGNLAVENARIDAMQNNPLLKMFGGEQRNSPRSMPSSISAPGLGSISFRNQGPDINPAVAGKLASLAAGIKKNPAMLGAFVGEFNAGVLANHHADPTVKEAVLATIQNANTRGADPAKLAQVAGMTDPNDITDFTDLLNVARSFFVSGDNISLGQ